MEEKWHSFLFFYFLKGRLFKKLFFSTKIIIMNLGPTKKMEMICTAEIEGIFIKKYY